MTDKKTEIQQETKKQEKKTVKKTSRVRRLIKTLAIIVVLSGILQYVGYYYALPILKDEICKLVTHKSQRLYSLDFKSFKINFLTKSVELENFLLDADTSVYIKRIENEEYNKGIYKISVKKLSIKNISFFALLKKKLIINKIELENPQIRLVAKPKKSEGKKYDAVHNDLFPIIEPFFNALIINSIKITDGYFDFNTKVRNEKSNIEVAKIDIKLSKFNLDKTQHELKNNLFFSESMEFNSENYDIILSDSIHTIKAGKLYINTSDSIIYAEGVILSPNGKKAGISSTSNKFKVGLKNIKITGLDINEAYFKKNVNLKNVIITEPSISFLQAGRVNKKTKKFEKFSSNFYPLIQGTLKSINIDSFSIRNADLKIAKANTAQKATYSAQNFNILLENFLLDSLAYQNKQKILYADNINIELSDYQMFLPDNRHKFSAKNILVSTNKKNIRAEKIIIQPTYKTLDSTAKQINIQIPKVDIVDIDIIKAYNSRQYEAKQVKIVMPNIKTCSFIDTSKTTSTQPKHNLVSALSEEFFKSLKIRTVSITKGDVNITSKASIIEDSLTLSGKMTLNIRDFTINKNTLQASKLPFLTTNVNLDLRDLVMKLPKDFHTLRCEEFKVNTQQDKVLIKNFSYASDNDSLIVSSVKRLGKSAIINISVNQAEFTKIQLLDMFFKGEIRLEKILVLKPQIIINQYPQLKRINDKNIELDSAKVSIRDSIEDSIYNLYTPFDKILADILPKEIKVIKADTIITDSSVLRLNILDTLNNRNVSTASDFKFFSQGFFFSRDSISEDKKFMLAKDYILDVNNFEFLLPDRVHLVKTGNIQLSTKDNFIKLKSVLMTERNRRRPTKSYFNCYIPKLEILEVDFKQFAETGILPAMSLKCDTSVIALNKNTDFQLDTTQRTKSKKSGNFPIKGVNIKEVSSNNSTFGFFRSDRLHAFENKVLKADFDVSVKDFSLDSANISKSGYIMNFLQPYVKLDSFMFRLKDSSLITTASAVEQNDSLKVKGFYWGRPDKQNHTRVTGKDILLTNSNYLDLIFQKKISGKFMDIKAPRIEIYPGNKKSTLNDVLYKMFNTIAFEVDTLTSKNIRMDIHLRDNKPTVTLQNMDLNISELNTIKYKDYDIPGKLVLAGINDHTFYMKDSIFKLNFPRAVLNPNTHTVWIKNMDFRPYTNRYDFCKSFDVAKSATFITCENAVAKNFDWKTAIEHKTLNMDSLYLNHLSFLSYGDNAKPNDTQIQPTLLEWLKRIPFYLNIKNTSITNSYLSIEQLHPASSVPGVLTINNINGYIHNLSNDDNHIKNTDTMIFAAKGKLMNCANVSGSFRYPRGSQNEEFYCKIKADSLFLPQLNPFLENALFAKINDGTLYSANIIFRSDNIASKGISSFEYRDLKVSLNKADSVQEKKRKLLTLLANMFVKKKNTKKIGYIYAEPDSTKSFSSYWVKSILSGVKATMGFESKEQKDERKLAEKFKDAFTRGRQKKKLQEEEAKTEN